MVILLEIFNLLWQGRQLLFPAGWFHHTTAVANVNSENILTIKLISGMINEVVMKTMFENI